MSQMLIISCKTTTAQCEYFEAEEISYTVLKSSLYQQLFHYSNQNKTKCLPQDPAIFNVALSVKDRHHKIRKDLAT